MKVSWRYNVGRFTLRQFVRGVKDIAHYEGVEARIDEERSWPVSTVYIDLIGNSGAVKSAEARMEEWAKELRR